MSSVNFSLAFLAGLLSFVSPCVLPMVPIYLGYLSGSSLYGEAPAGRWYVLRHALFFVAGFTFVFVILFGLPTTLLAGALQQYSDWIAKIGGAILILFGLHTMGVVTIPILSMTRRLEAGRGIEPGYVRSILLGVTFAAGWTPCVGPLLGTVMTLAFTEPSRALSLLFVYALGLAVPFLATAALLARAVGWLKQLNRYMRAIEIASGLLMVGVGILLISGTFTLLNSLLIRVTPEWLLRYL
jgi:cytochrome c-type biogenesis protein